jgi:hypothetical protein
MNTNKKMKKHQTPEEIREKARALFPKGTGELFYELLTNVAYLHLNWQNYKSLFGTSPERIDLLNWAASSFFGLLDRIMRHDVILAISRLMDPKESRGKKNVSLDCLIDKLKPSIDTTLFDKWQSELKELKGCYEPLRKVRNRLLSHEDLEITLQYHSDPLPGISRTCIENILEKIQKLLGDIEEHFWQSRTTYQYIPSIGDGEDLIFTLESAREHKRR